MWQERNLPGFVKGVTPTVSNHRGNEIDAWLKESRDNCQYAIIAIITPIVKLSHHY